MTRRRVKHQRGARVDGGAEPRTGRCLDAGGASSATGTRLILYDCYGGPNQRWQLP